MDAGLLPKTLDELEFGSTQGTRLLAWRAAGRKKTEEAA